MEFLKHISSQPIVPPKPIQQSIAESNYASRFCEKLLKNINEFDANLDQDKQVGIRLVSFGQTITFAVESLGYSNPSLISFYGVLDDGSKVQLVQHVSQISFLLLAVNKVIPNEPKHPIGFRVDQ